MCETGTPKTRNDNLDFLALVVLIERQSQNPHFCFNLECYPQPEPRLDSAERILAWTANTT
jgi:hypothetical protein